MANADEGKPKKREPYFPGISQRTDATPVENQGKTRRVMPYIPGISQQNPQKPSIVPVKAEKQEAQKADGSESSKKMESSGKTSLTNYKSSTKEIGSSAIGLEHKEAGKSSTSLPTNLSPVEKRKFRSSVEKSEENDFKESSFAMADSESVSVFESMSSGESEGKAVLLSPPLTPEGKPKLPKKEFSEENRKPVTKPSSPTAQGTEAFSETGDKKEKKEDEGSSKLQLESKSQKKLNGGSPAPPEEGSRHKGTKSPISTLVEGTISWNGQVPAWVKDAAVNFPRKYSIPTRTTDVASGGGDGTGNPG